MHAAEQGEKRSRSSSSSSGSLCGEGEVKRFCAVPSLAKLCHEAHCKKIEDLILVHRMRMQDLMHGPFKISLAWIFRARCLCLEVSSLHNTWFNLLNLAGFGNMGGKELHLRDMMHKAGIDSSTKIRGGDMMHHYSTFYTEAGKMAELLLEQPVYICKEVQRRVLFKLHSLVRQVGSINGGNRQALYSCWNARYTAAIEEQTNGLTIELPEQTTHLLEM